MTQIADERFVLKALNEEGWKGRVEDLRTLAGMGEKLRQRYENSCNYQWATTDSYSARTEEAEQVAVKFASHLGLTVYLQTDPRGATVYVRAKPHKIDDNRYSTQAQCLYFPRGDA
jgi:hypothetical protein